MSYMSLSLSSSSSCQPERYNGAPLNPKPKTIGLFLPHEMEHPLVNGFANRLSEKLKLEGIEPKMYKRGTFLTAAHILRRQLPNTTYGQNEIIDNLLNLDDYSSRAKMIANFLLDNGQRAIALELHGLDCLSWADEETVVNIQTPNRWERLGSTKILSLQDSHADYLENFAQSHEFFKSIGGNLEFFARYAASLIGMDIEAALKQFCQNAAFLNELKDMVKLVEIPGPLVHLPISDKMFSYYFEPFSSGEHFNFEFEGRNYSTPILTPKYISSQESIYCSQVFRRIAPGAEQILELYNFATSSRIDPSD